MERLNGQCFERDWQEWAYRDYVAAVRAASDRVAAVTARMDAALAGWSMAPVVRSLSALRGIDRITAMTLLSELGDVSRFDNPRQLMAYLGLVPSEHSSGERRRRGAITLTGNGTARRALVESAWSYRFPARQTRHLQEIDHRTGLPRLPEQSRLEREALAWGYEHIWAQAWL